jgi:hypothetical protein
MYVEATLEHLSIKAQYNVKLRGVGHSQTAGLDRSLALGIFLCLRAFYLTQKNQSNLS